MMAMKIKVKSIKYKGQRIKMPDGLAELLSDPNDWVPYKKVELNGYEEVDFIRDGKRVTRVSISKEQKQYA